MKMKIVDATNLPATTQADAVAVEEFASVGGRLAAALAPSQL